MHLLTFSWYGEYNGAINNRRISYSAFLRKREPLFIFKVNHQSFEKYQNLDSATLRKNYIYCFPLLYLLFKKSIQNDHFFEKNVQISPLHCQFLRFASNWKLNMKLWRIMRFSTKKNNELTNKQEYWSIVLLCPDLRYFVTASKEALSELLGTHVRASKKVWRWRARDMRFFANGQKYREFLGYAKNSV